MKGRKKVIKFTTVLHICKCMYCNKKLTTRSFIWDHVYLKSRYECRQGLLEVPCCESCNQSKSNQTLVGWLGELINSIKVIHKNDILQRKLRERRIRNIRKLIKLIKVEYEKI